MYVCVCDCLRSPSSSHHWCVCVCVCVCTCTCTCMCAHCIFFSFPSLPPSLPPQLQFHVSVLRALLIHTHTHQHILVSPVSVHTYNVHVTHHLRWLPTLNSCTAFTHSCGIYTSHLSLLHLLQTHGPLYCSSLTWSLPLERQ